MSKTRFALYFYYLAISLLTACAIVIVVKLIVFPPCVPKGNTCIVDPWSAAGLEGTVLGVSATVLAILVLQLELGVRIRKENATKEGEKKAS
jgi:hypothetical protein